MDDFKSPELMSEDELLEFQQDLLNNPDKNYNNPFKDPAMVDYYLNKKMSNRETSNQAVKDMGPLKNSPLQNNPDNDMLSRIMSSINKNPTSMGQKPQAPIAPPMPASLQQQGPKQPRQAQPEQVQPIEPMMPPAASAPTDLSDSSMKDALAREKQNNISLAMLQGFNDIGNSIAGVRTNPNYTQNLKPLAGADVAAIKTQNAADKEKLDLDSEKRKSDPASDRSVMARQSTKQFLDKLGYSQLSGMIKDNMSAKDVEDAMGKLNLQNLYSQWESMEGRKEIAKTMAGAKKERSEEDQKKFTRDLRKEATSGANQKIYTNFLNAEKIAGSFDKFATNPTGYSDYATLMGGLKTLQGDDSVVREAEIRLGMNAGSLKDKIKNYVDQLRKGTSLQPAQRNAILQTVKVFRDAYREQYKGSLSPLVEQARGEGLDIKQILPSQAAPLFDGSEQAPKFKVDQNKIAEAIKAKEKK